MKLPALFCPSCDAYVGRRPFCPACRSAVSRRWVDERSVAVAFEHDLPFLAAPLRMTLPTHTRLFFGYGRRGERAGGWLAIDAESGECCLPPHALDAAVTGVAAAPDRTTLLVSDDAGRLHAFHAVDGRPLWAEPARLSGAIEAPPLLPTRQGEPLALAATAEGVLAWFDWRSGRIVRTIDLARELGVDGGVRVAAAPAWCGDTALIAALETRRSGGGALFACTASGALDVLARSAAGLYTTPVILPGNRAVAVGSSAGELLSIDLRTGAVVTMYAAGKIVRAAPALAGNTLYVGTGARRLCAVDASSGEIHWEFDWHHSIPMTPAVAGGLVIFADSSGCCVAVDTATRAEVWRFAAGDDRPGQAAGMTTAAMLGGFVVHDDSLWCGAANGRIYRMAWHGGNWRWCEHHAHAQGRWRAAAAAIVFGDRSPHAGQRAARLLDEKGEHAAAAQVYLAMGERTEAAIAYEKAAQASRLPSDWHHAAALWLALAQPARAAECQARAAEVGNRPLLQIDVVAATALKLGEKGRLHLRLVNLRPVKARRVRVELHAPDFAPAPPFECPEVMADLPVQCEFGLEPAAAGVLTVTVSVACEDAWGNPQPRREWQGTLHVAAADRAPVQVNVAKLFTGTAHVVEAQGDIGLVRQVGEAAAQVQQIGREA